MQGLGHLMNEAAQIATETFLLDRGNRCFGAFCFCGFI